MHNMIQHHWEKHFDTKNFCVLKVVEPSTSNLAHAPKPKIFSNGVVYILNIFRLIYPASLCSNEFII